MDYQEMVRRLYGLADVGIVNAKADTQLLRDAALFIDCQQLKIEAMKEKIYELEERLAIMEDGNALSLLKAQEPMVMTLEEIEDALDNVVWLDIPGAENLADGFSLIMAYSRKNGFVLLDSPFGDNPSQERFEYTDYNKTWRCWTSRPTDEQREATPWAG